MTCYNFLLRAVFYRCISLNFFVFNLGSAGCSR